MILAYKLAFTTLYLAAFSQDKPTRNASKSIDSSMKQAKNTDCRATGDMKDKIGKSKIIHTFCKNHLILASVSESQTWAN